MRRSLLAVVLALAAGCASAPAPAPEKPAAPVAAAAPAPDPEAWRAQAPTPGASPELVLPRFERATLDNGLTVLVSTRKELPLVYAGVAFAAGSAQDPKGRAGLADLTYEAMLEGAGKRDTLALDNAFGDLGTQPSQSISQDGALIGVQVLKRHGAAAVELLADVARRPTFNAKDFERRKQLKLAELVQRTGQPSAVAQETFARLVFGEGHPYGHTPEGVPGTVQPATLAEVKAFHQKHVGPKAAALVMTGDVTLEEAVALAKRHFGDWKGKAELPPVPVAPPVPAREQVVYVAKPGLGQTVVLMGRPGVALGNPEEAPLDLAMSVFGGFFGSRLNMNLREDKGYTYGARASSTARLGPGPVAASAQVRADVTGPSLSEFFKELEGLESRPITAEELAAAREGLIRALPGQFETVSSLGASAAALFYLRRPLDEYARTAQALQEATAEQVQRAAEAYLAPGSLQVVLVGDPDTIARQVGPLGLGALVAVQPEGLPAAPGAPAAKK